MQKKSVVVLLGGWSSEREVSLSSGAEVTKALVRAGYDVRAVDVKQDLPELLKQLTPRPDVVFNALHGTGGEDGIIQGILDTLNMPYTHSGVGASSLAMNKVLSKKIFSFEGIPTPPWKIMNRYNLRTSPPFPLPVVVKPIKEGSSRGVFIVQDDFPADLFDGNWSFGEDVLVEPYVKGRELSVGILGKRALGVIEIRPKTGFYDYHNKYTDGVTDHIMPAPLSESEREIVLDLALRAHHALGCRSVSRADFIYHEGVFHLLEVNTHPGLTPLSLLPEIAAYYGTPFEDLLTFLIEDAACCT